MNVELIFLILAMVMVVITLVGTIYAFWNKKYMDRGPKKGVAANPNAVRKQNQPDADQ